MDIKLRALFVAFALAGFLSFATSNAYAGGIFVDDVCNQTDSVVLIDPDDAGSFGIELTAQCEGDVEWGIDADVFPFVGGWSPPIAYAVLAGFFGLRLLRRM